jgi:hypothetical protein
VFCTLQFTGVSQFNQLTDLSQLADHAGPGNVSHWVTDGETSHVHLAGGLISVAAASVHLVAEA